MQSELCEGINKTTSCPGLTIRQGSDCSKQPRSFLAVTTELIFLLSLNLAFQFLVLFCLLLGMELGQFALMCVKAEKKEPLKQIGRSSAEGFSLFCVTAFALWTKCTNDRVHVASL